MIPPSHPSRPHPPVSPCLLVQALPWSLTAPGYLLHPWLSNPSCLLYPRPYPAETALTRKSHKRIQAYPFRQRRQKQFPRQVSLLLLSQHPLRPHPHPPAVVSLIPRPSLSTFLFTSASIILPTLTHYSQTSPPSYRSITLTHHRYGLNDGNGSPNCNAATVSCGFYNTPGYNAAVSQNLFGAASGKTGTCGTCWQLDPVSNPNAEDTTAVVPGLNSIVVMVNNLCPASSNEKDVSVPIYYLHSHWRIY